MLNWTARLVGLKDIFIEYRGVTKGRRFFDRHTHADGGEVWLGHWHIVYDGQVKGPLSVIGGALVIVAFTAIISASG